MSATQITFDSSYLAEQGKRFGRIRQSIHDIAWDLKRTSVLGGFECNECRGFSDDLDRIIKGLEAFKAPVENIRNVFQLASSHTDEDGKKAKLGADAMFEKMKEKYGVEASSYNPSTVFKPEDNKTVPLTPVPALASVIVRYVLVGLEKIPWVKKPTTMTLARTMMYEAQETRALEKSFASEEFFNSMFQVIYKSDFQLQYRSALNSLAIDGGN